LLPTAFFLSKAQQALGELRPGSERVDDALPIEGDELDLVFVSKANLHGRNGVAAPRFIWIKAKESRKPQEQGSRHLVLEELEKPIPIFCLWFAEASDLRKDRLGYFSLGRLRSSPRTTVRVRSQYWRRAVQRVPNGQEKTLSIVPERA
jgi:hypothetical protein